MPGAKSRRWRVRTAAQGRGVPPSLHGPIYGVDWGNDGFLIVDPLEHTAEELRIPVLDPKVPPGKSQTMPVPSLYWGDTLYWYDPAITNHAAMDGRPGMDVAWNRSPRED